MNLVQDKTGESLLDITGSIVEGLALGIPRVKKPVVACIRLST